MHERTALNIMVPPGARKPGKYREGVIQVHLTRACNLACFNCTQASNLAGKSTFMSVDHFAQACDSLKGWSGVVGIFGGCPTLHPQFADICAVFREKFPDKDQRGLWANNLMGKGAICRETFSTRHSNLNVHMDRAAYDEFKHDWPEAHPVGLDTDSRHSPPWVALKDVVSDEGDRWELISDCQINKNWSAMIGVFRGQLRAWFCEVAGAQSILHQDEPDYPDTGLDPTRHYNPNGLATCHDESGPVGLPWWRLGMGAFRDQVRKHCHECGVPLRGHGELAQAGDEGKEQVSATHQGVYRPKRKGRSVELVTVREQLGKPLDSVVKYLQNSKV